MTFAGPTIRRLLLLLACLATVVVLGTWDGRREMQRVLDQGYATTAEITGAQRQRLVPLAMDGWWPRFVEQGLSVDLKWQGKDGRTREYKKVPVTEKFAATIVTGDQIRLAIVPVKVIDNERAVPVVVADAVARMSSLQSWLRLSGYAAMFAWAGLAAFGVWQVRRAMTGSVTVAPARFDLPRRPLFGALAIIVGGIIAFYGWSAGQPWESTGGIGNEIQGDIVNVVERPASGGTSAAYSVQLAWKDGQGAIRRYGPVTVSEAFWKKVTKDGVLVVSQARIRVFDDDPQGRPVIVDDTAEVGWQARAGHWAGFVVIAGGVLLILSAAVRAWRV